MGFTERIGMGGQKDWKARPQKPGQSILHMEVAVLIAPVFAYLETRLRRLKCFLFAAASRSYCCGGGGGAEPLSVAVIPASRFKLLPRRNAKTVSAG